MDAWDFIAVAGFVAITAGVGLVSIPASICIAGVGLLVLGVIGSRWREHRRHGG